MKKVIVAGMFFLGALASAEVLKGKALEAQIVKMGTCVGVKNLEGHEFSFKTGGKVAIRVANDEADEGGGSYGNEYENSYGNETETQGAYEGSYDGAYENESETDNEIHGHWTVKGASVLVNDGSASYNLVIGFKSKTCWAQ